MDNSDSSDFDNFEINATPPEIISSAQKAYSHLLPSKSVNIYEQKYKMFMDWCKIKGISKFSENALLAYFAEELCSYKPSTLWSIFSMLKSTLKVKNDVDISTYHKLVAFLKQKSKNFKPKKSGIFEKHHFTKFIVEAPDSKFLPVKVAFIIGICGACRREELMKMSIHDIEDKETVLIIKIPDTKNGVERLFTVLNPNKSIDFLAYIRKYIALRPSNITTVRLFLKYNGKICTKQPIGINTFGKMPSIIAEYLKLPNPTSYTGHSFRRSSATMLANSGGDLLTVKKHGGWKSSTVAEGYVDSTISKKVEISRKILSNNVASTHGNENENVPESSSCVPESSATSEATACCIEQSNITNYRQDLKLPDNITNNGVISEKSNAVLCNNKAQGLPFNNCSFNNCTINININNK